MCRDNLPAAASRRRLFNGPAMRFQLLGLCKAQPPSLLQMERQHKRRQQIELRHRVKSRTSSTIKGDALVPLPIANLELSVPLCPCSLWQDRIGSIEENAVWIAAEPDCTTYEVSNEGCARILN